MKLFPLLIAFLVPCHGVFADTITSGSSVNTQGLFASDNCSQSSAGAFVECNTTAGIAEASASAAFGMLSVFAEAGGAPARVASANAFASYDFTFLLPGVPTGTITGEYEITGEGIPLGQPVGPALGINQSNAVSPKILTMGSFDETIKVVSTFTAGDMFEISATGGANVSGSFGGQSETGSLTLIGLFDSNGILVAPGIGEVPEPNSLPVLCVSFTGLYAWRRKRRRQV